MHEQEHAGYWGSVEQVPLAAAVAVLAVAVTAAAPIAAAAAVAVAVAATTVAAVAVAVAVITAAVAEAAAGVHYCFADSGAGDVHGVLHLANVLVRKFDMPGIDCHIRLGMPDTPGRLYLSSHPCYSVE